MSPLSPPEGAPGVKAPPASAVVAAPKRSFWEELRYSHSFWGYVFRLGAYPMTSRVTRYVQECNKPSIAMHECDHYWAALKFVLP